MASDDQPLTLTRAPARTKLAEQVADQLLAEIRAQKLPPGAKVPSERVLMEQLGVGRSTIREAINGLAMMGVLEQHHGKGAFVVNPRAGSEISSLVAALSRGVTRELFEARRLVEIDAARLAAERRTAEDIEQLAAVLVEHERAIIDGRVAAEPSADFHVKVAHAAHNSILAGFVDSYSAQLASRGPLLEREPGFKEWEIEQHREIFEPIRDGDSKAAAAAMRRHLDAVVKRHERLGIPH